MFFAEQAPCEHGRYNFSDREHAFRCPLDSHDLHFVEGVVAGGMKRVSQHSGQVTRNRWVRGRSREPKAAVPHRIAGRESCSHVWASCFVLVHASLSATST